MQFTIFGFTFTIGKEPVDTVGLTRTGRAKVASALGHLFATRDLDFWINPLEDLTVTAGDRMVEFFVEDFDGQKKQAEQDAVMLLVRILRHGIPDDITEVFEGVAGPERGEDDQFGPVLAIPTAAPENQYDVSVTVDPERSAIDEMTEVINQFHKTPTIDKFTHGGVAEEQEETEMASVAASFSTTIEGRPRKTRSEAAQAADLQRLAIMQDRVTFPVRTVKLVSTKKQRMRGKPTTR